MRILLDTNILVWAWTRSRRLPQTVRDTMTDPATNVFFSAASIWEVAITYGLGRADFDLPPADLHAGALQMGFVELPVRAVVASLVAALPGHHRDPFDRLLIAQSMADGLNLVTADPLMTRYGAAVTLIP
jgi:PIN domain nuclease of toxin-antitoxin system